MLYLVVYWYLELLSTVSLDVGAHDAQGLAPAAEQVCCRDFNWVLKAL